MKMLARKRASPETPNAKSISWWLAKCARCSSLSICWYTSRSSCEVGAGSSSVYSTPSTRTTGGVPALRCRSLARAAIIFSSTVRMFMTPSPLGPRRRAETPRGPGPGRTSLSERLHQEQFLSELHRLCVLDEDPHHTALVSASISFISFIASMMHTVWPTSITSPTSTNGSASGAGER
jgi:hypothetical protein